MTGRKDEMVGGIKQGLGKLTGDEGLEAEGAAQKNMGQAERKTSGTFHEAKGSLKKGVGDMIGSPTLEAEGEAEKLQGKAEKL
jgi:uncharacterized protein YjbJ (UPF0337 family)